MAWPTSPQVQNFRYWPFLQTRLDVWRNATVQSGGNVALVWVHGGGWAGNSKDTVTDAASDGGYDLCNYVLTSGLTTQKWSVVGVDYRMSAYTSPIKMSFPSYFPESFRDPAFAVQAIKDNARRFGTNPTANAKSWGLNPNKIVLFGSSAGATNCMVTAFRRSEPIRSGSPWDATRRFCYRESSIPAIVINYIGLIDFRFDTVLNVETFPHNLVGSVFGTSTTDGGIEYGLLPNDLKAAASPLAYLEAQRMDARPAGVYNIYFGPTTPTSKPYNHLHPSEQLPIIYAACQAKQIDTAQDLIPAGDWKNYLPTPTTSPSYAISGRIVSFCEPRLPG